MNLEELESIISKNMTITDERLYEAVMSVSLDIEKAAQAAERERRRAGARLTDEEIKTLWVENLITVSEEQGYIRFARAIERRISGEKE